MKKILMLLVLLISTNVFSQEKQRKEVDSLLLEARKNAGINPVKMVEISTQALEFAKKINYKTGEANAFRFMGSGYYLQGNFKEAEKYFLNGLKISEEINEPKGKMACLSNLGAVYNVQNKYTEALNYYQKAIRVGEITKDEQTIGITYGNMGVIYSELKNYDLALQLFQKGLEKHQSLNNDVGIATGFGNIGNVYFFQKNYQKALEFYQKALNKNIEINNNPGIAREYGNIANVYSELKNFDQSFENHQKALKINEALKNKKGIAINYHGIGKYFLETAKYNESLNYLQQAKELAKTINILDVQKESYDDLSKAFEKKGEMDSAYYYFKKYIEVKENIENEDNRKKISRLEIQFEFDSKEQKYKHDQQLANEKLVQQELFLELNKSKLNESNKEKDLARLNFLKTQAELKTEQIETKAQRKQLDLIEKDNLLKQNQIKLNQLQLQAKEKQKYFYLAGIGLFAIIGGLLFYQSRNRKRTNQNLQTLNKELDQANQIKTRFFGILNHDLRSPVANLIHFLHLQKENPELLDEETRKKYENKTIEGVENLLVSMEDLLLWSKGQMENFKPQPKNIRIENLFTDTKKIFSGYIHIQFLYENPQDIEVYTDENYLKTIVRNLISNAINAFDKKENATITCKAWQEHNHTFISVIDNGSGANQKQFDALYDDQKVVGIKNGLGLHLIRDMAKAIHCEITVDSKINEGTCFLLKL